MIVWEQPCIPEVHNIKEGTRTSMLYRTYAEDPLGPIFPICLDSYFSMENGFESLTF